MWSACNGVRCELGYEYVNVPSSTTVAGRRRCALTVLSMDRNATPTSSGGLASSHRRLSPTSDPANGQFALPTAILRSARSQGHDWDVNHGMSRHHDSQFAWNSATAKCLMDPDRDRKLGVVALHDETAPSIDLYCIRSHVDDLNQTSCTWP